MALSVGPARATDAPTVNVDAAEEGPVEDGVDPTPFVIRVDAEDLDGSTVGAGDLLDGVPDAHVRRTGAIGRAETLQLRGASGQQLVVWLDDIPLTGARGGGFDLSTLPTAYVDRIDVVRGPAAAEYGSGGIGGAILLRTRPVRPGWSSRARLMGGSEGLAHLDGAWAWGGERWDVLTAASGMHTEGAYRYRDTNGAVRTRQNNEVDRVAGLARGRMRVGGTGRLTLLAEGLEDRRGEPGREQFESATAASRQARALGAVSWHDDAVGGSDFGARVTTWYAQRRYRFENPDRADQRASLLYDTADRTVGGRARLRWYGAASQLPSLTVEGVRERADTLTDDGRAEASRAESRLRGAVILADEAWLFDERLTIAAVLRADASEGRELAWVPKAGAVYRPRPWIALRGNVGRVFRDPSFDELYFESAGIFGNPNLRFEDGIGWDAGVELRLGAAAVIEGTWFSQRMDRLILFVPVDAFRVRAEDRFGARVDGQSLRMAAELRPLRLDVVYTHLDATFTDTPRAPLPYRPAHRLHGRLGVKIEAAELYGAVEARSSVTSDRFGQRTLEGYATWTVGAEGPVGGGFHAAVAIRNLADHLGAVDALQEPLPGRTFLLSVRHEWSGARAD